MNSEASKPANSLNVSIKKSKRQTLDNDYNKRLNLKRRKDSKKKLDMALKRISRCRPGGGYGYDPVIKRSKEHEEN